MNPLFPLRYVAFGMLCALISIAHAKTTAAVYSHDFWLPQYHQQRLSYCLSDKQICGKTVADRYCQNLGYERSQRATIDHNIGMASYLDKKGCCQGWHCAGFKLIRCDAQAKHRPKRNYYYRYKKFVLPRFQHYRIDWCYQNGKHCGKRAAESFCRHMGYEAAKHYQPEAHLGATQALGNQKLCFGDCTGFSNIICYR
jgi:hypothetical protein